MVYNHVLVTGGAGFIGSNLVQHLLKQNSHVTVFDNFSVANNLQKIKSDRFDVIKGDLTSSSDLQKLPSNFDVIFHLAADPEVRLTVTNAESIFRNNIEATYNLLEWAKDTAVHTIVFTSSSTVYGDANIIPTPESHRCHPISLYGESKLACESLISPYCYAYKKRGIVVRLANVIGPTSGHGILFDMIAKLKKNSAELEILGDGTQNKSYLYIDDCISGIVSVLEKTDKNFETYNLGSNSQITVKEIIDMLLEMLNFSNTTKKFTGGVDGGRGWVGDVKNMFLDISKIKSIGWNSTLDSRGAIRKTIQLIRKD